MAVDGTDCRILELSPFDTKWYSHKFNGPGVRYEVDVSIGNGHVTWIDGPFPCGTYLDIKVFNSDLKKRLLSDEQFIADRGDKNQSCVYRVKNYEGVSSRLLA